MPRRLPTFAAVRAFEAAARHVSVAAAAEELGLTPSAVSHQIQALESYLDTALFWRRGNRLELTLTGRSYGDRLSSLLDGLDTATRRAGRANTTLRVLTTPGFAARWMAPRLDRFLHAAQVRLRVSEGAPSTDFAGNDADVVVSWGCEPMDGLSVEPLLASGRFPVASPDYIRREEIRTPADLLRATLLHDEVMDGWADWFREAGVDVPSMPRGPVFPHCELATTAAEHGQGVELAYEAIVRETLRTGTLVRLFGTPILPTVIYSFTCATSRADEPLIRAFREWLFAEVAMETKADEVAACPAAD